MGTNLDVLVIENFLLIKEQQDKSKLKNYKKIRVRLNMQKEFKYFMFLKLLIFTWLTLVSYNSLRKHELYLYDAYCFMINLVPFALCLILLIFIFYKRKRT